MKLNKTEGGQRMTDERRRMEERKKGNRMPLKHEGICGDIFQLRKLAGFQWHCQIPYIQKFIVCTQI